MYWSITISINLVVRSLSHSLSHICFWLPTLEALEWKFLNSHSSLPGMEILLNFVLIEETAPSFLPPTPTIKESV